MTLNQITEDNFSSLLRSIDPSFHLLGGLRSVPFVKDRIFVIDQQPTDDQKIYELLNVLLQVPDYIQQRVMNGFISALRSSGQDHVANVFRRKNDKIIMSDKHYQLLSMKRPGIGNFMNPRDGFFHADISQISEKY